MDQLAGQQEMWEPAIDVVTAHLLHDERSRSWTVRARIRRSGQSWEDGSHFQRDDVMLDEAFDELVSWLGKALFS